MGFFDDLFGGAAHRKAAEAQRAFFDQTRNQGNADINLGYGAGVGAVGAGTDAARKALTATYGDATGAINTGAGGALGHLNQGLTGAQGALTGARADLGRAGGAYDSLSDLATKYGAGSSLLLDAYGAGGAGGADRARAAFQTGPGYNFNLEQGLESINRRRNMGGMLNSGNADRDAQTFGAGLASNEFDKWRTGLSQFAPLELSATSGAATGRAGIGRDLANLGVTEADLINRAGIGRAGIETGRGTTLAELAARQGGSLSALESGQGFKLADLASGAAGQKVGLATSLAVPQAATWGKQADAQAAGAGNVFSALLGLGTLGAKLPRPSFGSGGGPSSLAGSSAWGGAKW